MNVFLLDGTYELFRHFFAMPAVTATEGGEVGATRGVVGSVIAMLEEGGRFPVDTVISRTIRIEEAPQAMAEWAADPSRVIKMMLNLDQQEAEG